MSERQAEEEGSGQECFALGTEGDLAARVRSLMGRARSDLERLVAIPSVADPSVYPQEHCLQAAALVRDAFEAVGIAQCEVLPMPDGHPAVHGSAPAPAGAPTILLYAHYDVQPPMAERQWRSPPFVLTERDGRWYGRGAADCKGNIVAQLTALRALQQEGLRVGLKVLVEGAEEQGTGGLERFIERERELIAADAVLVCDSGNVAAGLPTLTVSLRGVVNLTVTVRTLKGAMHSGMFGGPAPDALVALVRMLGTLHDDAGDVSVRGIDATGRWEGSPYEAQAFIADVGMLDGVSLIGSGSVSDMLWARPAINFLGIDCPSVAGSAAAIQPQARARVSMRLPPGVDLVAAEQALTAHLKAVAPWGAHVEIAHEASGKPFQTSVNGPFFAAMVEAMRASYGAEVTLAGQGGSIPLCAAFAEVLEGAEVMLLGVEEPQCLIHAPNESVDPAEIERTALTIASFLRNAGFMS